MRLLDLTLPTPEQNLALDEALLDWVEAGQGPECLRFWEAPQPFVVLGCSDRVATEVRAPACRDAHCPILRRCTGGGTVLQGPGSFSYALILLISPELSSLTRTNNSILEKHRQALKPLANATIELRGATDLAFDGRKFSGNSQRRRRLALLFHGTFLRHANFNLMEHVLPSPSRQPDYRAGRSHRDFLTTFDVPETELRAALAQAWNADQLLTTLPLEVRARVDHLVQERYARPDWTNRR